MILWAQINMVSDQLVMYSQKEIKEDERKKGELQGGLEIPEDSGEFRDEVGCFAMKQGHVTHQ